MTRSVLALVLAGTLTACRQHYTADGRLPADELFSRLELLPSSQWAEDSVLPEKREAILFRRTRRTGPALWLLSGIHGEEPAGPNAIAREINSLRRLEEAGVPIVVFPLLNSNGYRRNWRYPNTPERDWRKGGISVSDAEHLLPDLKTGSTPRTPRPAGPETAALTARILELVRDYPPRLMIDLHEDELSSGGGYVYSQGTAPMNNPAALEIVRLLSGAGIQIRMEGKTRFGEPIRGGVIAADDSEKPIKDGSIDELFAAETIFINGAPKPGPFAKTVIVVETPANPGSQLEQRVAGHAAVLRSLQRLWEINEGGPSQ